MTDTGWFVVRDALALAARRRDDDARRTRACRPRTRPSMLLSDRASASRARSSSRSVCEPALDYGAEAGALEARDGDSPTADASGGGPAACA